MIDLRKIKRTDFHLSWQHPETIAKFNKVIDKKLDIGSAEMIYKLNLISYKRPFWQLCTKKHSQMIVV